MKSTFKKMNSDESSRRRKLATSGAKLTEEEVTRIKMSKEGRCNYMKYKSEILEMARLACAFVPENICEEMDISDDYFLEIRKYIHEQTGSYKIRG